MGCTLAELEARGLAWFPSGPKSRRQAGRAVATARHPPVRLCMVLRSAAQPLPASGEHAPSAGVGGAYPPAAMGATTLLVKSPGAAPLNPLEKGEARLAGRVIGARTTQPTGGAAPREEWKEGEGAARKKL